jgi:hypothetical protein
MASKIATMPLEKLLEMRTAVDAEIMARSGGSGSAAGAAKKAKKPKRVSQGSAWADFTQMIVKEKADEYTAFKEASETKLGVAPRFVAAYRKAHEAEWEAFQTTWNAEHPKAAKGSVASAAEESASADEGSVTSGASEKVASGKRRGPKKLTDMTPEERTAHDAAVQKRREAKKAPSAAAEEEAKAAAPVVVAAPVAAPKPAPLPLKAAPAKPVAAPAPVAEEAEEEEGVEERIFTLDGQKYIRLWDSGAEDWATGDLWAVKANGERDYYCGELMEDGSINTDAEEPELD